MIAITLTRFCIDNGICTKQLILSDDFFIVESPEELENIRTKGEKYFSKAVSHKIKLLFDISDNPKLIKQGERKFPIWMAMPDEYIQNILIHCNEDI